MSDDIMNQSSQVHRLAAGEFYGLWRGQGIYLAGGRDAPFQNQESGMDVPGSLRCRWSRHSQ
jgi:hypothetical protein